jgi:hypothetical protein
MTRSVEQRSVPDQSDLACSFCGRDAHLVAKLAAGGARPGIYICDECVDAAVAVMRED